MFSLIQIVMQKILLWRAQFRLRFLDTWLALPFFPARHLFRFGLSPPGDIADGLDKTGLNHLYCVSRQFTADDEKIAPPDVKTQTVSLMFHRFVYESEFYPDLSRVPMYVRMKLDLTGVKISLDDWLAFSFEERTVLCHFPVESEEEKKVFIAYLNFLSSKYRGAPAAMTDALECALWDSSHNVPTSVLEKSAGKAPAVTNDEWTRWKSYERYALYKTSKAKRDTEAFFALLTELREKRA